MKMIFKIARTELRNLFYSPVAWFLTVVFLIFCGYFYTTPVHTIALFQDTAVKNMPKFTDFGMTLTNSIFLNPDGIFVNVLKNLFLFVPLLTMGLISREINNGTVNLLYSSPVSMRQIVLGKFLAIMAYNFLLLLIIAMFSIMGAFNIVAVDYGLLLSAMLGFFLLMCAYAAIGMFMSSLSTYQIVSAIATFVLFFILGRIGTLWQQFDFVRDLTYFLAINGRTDKMMAGLITTKDLIYFILIASMFVSFTILKLKGARESVPWYKKSVRYLTVIVVVLVTGYLTSRPGYIGYLDATETKSNTVTKKTQELLKAMGDEPIEVTLYTNLLGANGPHGMPEARNQYISKVWEPYIRFNPNIQLKYVMYYDAVDGDSGLYKMMPGKNIHEIAKEYTKFQQVKLNWFMPPQDIRKIINLNDENMQLVMQVKYKGKSMFLRTYTDPKVWPDEEHYCAVFRRLLETEIPKLYAATGSLERDIYKKGEREYDFFATRKSNRFSLINHGFELDTVNIQEREVPADATELLVADPKVIWNEKAVAHFKNYLDRGGNMMIVGEPGKQHVINPMLQYAGASLLPGTVVEVTKDEMPHMVMPYVNHDFGSLVKSAELEKPLLKNLKDGDTSRFLHAGTAPVGYADSAFKIKHLEVTRGRNAWVKTGVLVTDSAAPVFTALEGDYKRDSFDITLALSRQLGNKEQRIVVSGDADFLSTLRGGSLSFSMLYWSWLHYEKYPIKLVRPKPKDVLLTISPETADVQKSIFIWILPAAVMVLGTVLLIRRKRK
ncbi:ABC transporter permease subunit [Pseudobacter ginsenosidimutans]|uniref:ABC-2 type transport system permease protein n=1 Tax=Pseudobacter ginsenosidimutans TaxID=661488 RepID=A0A4V2EZ83_9BACT|nr:Gldg family protein [Pseudobacter ginsenosidimutans]QEC45320.1 ABC transporter permease subunit [Pseudobacter ginsenosidimutans]RZS65590.1 ABC-2 type transport system permease protein [Pseudobacter ginsenosidimutans]